MVFGIRPLFVDFEFLIIVRRICAKICDNRGFLRTSMKLGRVLEHDLRNNLRSEGTSDLTFGDL